LRIKPRSPVWSQPPVRSWRSLRICEIAGCTLGPLKTISPTLPSGGSPFSSRIPSSCPLKVRRTTPVQISFGILCIFAVVDRIAIFLSHRLPVNDNFCIGRRRWVKGIASVASAMPYSGECWLEAPRREGREELPLSWIDRFRASTGRASRRGRAPRENLGARLVAGRRRICPK